MKIKTIFKNITSIFLALAIAATTFTFHSSNSQAWEQGANGSHEEINKTAISRFFNAAASNPKFANSPIDRSKQFLGNETTSATLSTSGFTIKKSSLTFSQWVTHGGFSADEPEVWACVRHFYDPLAVNGVPQLTDHLALHGFVYTTISAKEWAFKAAENPYSWRKAMEYYKMAMEIPDDAQITVIKGVDFRDPDITVSSAAEARSVYLGKAFRALGETMHMMADITQPSHVRNDSHPAIDTDPLESTVNKDTVRLVRDSPVLPSIGGAIDSAATMEQMYEKIAIFTNYSFYTDDTVSDAASGVKQSNHENPYPHPQFSELTLDTKTGVYSKTFNSKPVPMTQQTLTSYLLGPPWTDYTVPAAFAKEQAEVLVPIAIKANTKVINSFFPTFDLTLDVKQNKDASTNGDANYKEYSLGTELKHLSGSDVEWQQQNLAIKYTGPAELWGETKGKARKIADLKFKAGVPVNPLTVFVGDEKFQKVDKYQINNVDTIYVTINAGGRIINSKKLLVSMPVQLSISPATLTAELNKEYTFTAKTDSPVVKASYTWTLNGAQTQSTTSNTYKTKFTAAGNYKIGVKLIGSDGKEIASTSATVDIFTATSTTSVSTTSAKNPLADLQKTTRARMSVTMQATRDDTNYREGTHSTGTTVFTVGAGSSFDSDSYIPITWSGASFTGKSDYLVGNNSRRIYEISGTVSADGKTISTKYSYQRKDGEGTVLISNWSSSFEVSNAPLSISGSYAAINQTGEIAGKSVTKFEWRQTTNYEGKEWGDIKIFSPVATDKSAITVAFAP